MKLLASMVAMMAVAQIASASHDPLGERVTNAVRKASETGSQLRMHALGEAKSCTSSDALASNVEVSMSPSNPGPGDKYDLKVSYDLGDTTIDGGKAVYKASLSGVPVVDETDDLCEDLKNGDTPCPLSGHVESTSSNTVPEDLPHGKLHSTITYKDSGGQEIVCFEVDTQL